MAGDGELFRFLQRVATARYRLVVVRTSTELCQLRVARQFISGAGNADETARITAQAVAN
jgi:hypothetical protein